MSLASLMETALPLNRKERYFTGTVLPMVVCANDFRGVGVLASLIPGCELPPIDPHPKTANVQFFTEYCLADSIFDRRSRDRFPNAPKTKDTPDLMILVKGARSVLIALEAKMFHQPSGPALVRQMRAQRAQLAYLRKRLHVADVYHAALLPRDYWKKVQGRLSRGPREAFPVILWEDVVSRFRTQRGANAYFLGILDLALTRWDDLAAKPLGGANAESKLTGEEIWRRFGRDVRLSVMGRTGGLSGAALTDDVDTGRWRRQMYEVSSNSKPPNSNWFPIEAFVQLVSASTPVSRDHYPDRAKSTVRSLRILPGNEIVTRRKGLRTVGRAGGLHGKAFARDIRTGAWRERHYQVSDRAVPANRNWFTVREFIGRIST